jgi:FkbH-like protein
MTQGSPEAVRLVIWDLDETFWNGTLTEGGMTYRRDIHDMVITLAKRGIVSSICSKNDFAQVKEILQAEGIWDYFVFPSISWEPKGPRLAALVETVQLRSPTILFIDDNPQNLGEAAHFVPGIQVADETVIPGLLDNPLLKGKNDEALSRLAQYKLLETRKRDESAVGGDTRAFLRESDIRVTIDHDIEKHLDRAIEMINRTNQLNYTKTRLSEDIETARSELRELLSSYRMQAGIVHVRDRYGDYGYCGLYVMMSGGSGQQLLHFCFSCRILNMGVETWLYQRLGRPGLRVKGEVLTDVKQEREIDWITYSQATAEGDPAAAPKMLDHVYIRGGCDMIAVGHYLSVSAEKIYGEYNSVRNGVAITFQHSMFGRYAIEGIKAEALAAMRRLGYQDHDFISFLSEKPRAGVPAVWVLSFWSDFNGRLYKHKATGAMLPLALPGLRRAQELKEAGAPGGDAFDWLEQDYEFVGHTPPVVFQRNLRMILERAPRETHVFVLLSDENITQPDGRVVINQARRRMNRLTTDVTGDFSNVTLLPMGDFILSPDDLKKDRHYDRRVYFRVFERIMQELGRAGLRVAAE